MKSFMKYLPFIIVLVVIIAVIVIICIKKNRPIEVWDGPGSVYEWTSYELYGDWVQADKPGEKDNAALKVDGNTIRIVNRNGEDQVIGYTLPEGIDTEGYPDGEVVLNLEQGSGFSSFIFHEEYEDGGSTRVPVLSATIFEYDGRGEIVVAEFVRESQNDMVREGYESSLAKRRNSWEGVPSMVKEAPSNKIDE